MQSEVCEVTESGRLYGNTYILWLTMPASFQSAAYGQFVMAYAGEMQDPLLGRAISIHRLRTTERGAEFALLAKQTRGNAVHGAFSFSFGDADSLRVAPTVDFDATAIVSGRASLGYRRFMPLDGRLPNFQGLVGSAVLTHTVASITRLDLQAERDIDYSYDPLQPFFVRSDVRLTVSQRVVGPLELIAIGGRRHVK